MTNIETESLSQRVKKLIDSKPVMSNGKEYEGLYELNNKSAEKKDKTGYDTFRYYVVGLKMEGFDYTVKLVIGVKNGYTYYDHALTPIEKGKLLRSIDEIKRPFASKESLINGEIVSDALSECKDKRLISILQIK